ncbi:hypothetical protein RJZ56_003141 [Blastomyces dermatitidis]|uniref:BZIP domain-containing protein n=3 Tax=Blastomyces TaxID=229219 RepID=A0A179V6H8_BLAGS|nr:uncharacterized protein BDBG_09336 [Blastomyces gilchristii SLH14081]XP_045281259.1 uncharacterized protein BDCG_05427 [Blastomyces dermatitidis ER-3]EGE80672.1 hypothetical protein BDDG_03613 [Blastomyces dermatitidis ATCC 18188]EQL29466.1 hypothetical protein BDFG_07901 [Blastomyces dermatitidis ATCC 26199]OAT01532.1 hypothetical protein BDCG_05427 [Blastomyces dermatitidis ER-3]OAT14272.1 hypothetical protein BDBG_09336 [Blastomyces gilchristii SLH14081]
MSATLQKTAAAASSSPSPNPYYHDTLDSLWTKTKEKLHISRKQAVDEENNQAEAEGAGVDYDTLKSAHARRREQVRRAQRNHRERKEKYIKSLEQELSRLRDESSSIQTETYQVAEENSILRDIMLAHGIALPGTGISHSRPQDQWLYNNPMATVSVIGSPGFGQRLEVSLGGAPVERVFPPGFGIPESPPEGKSQLSVVDHSKRGMVPKDGAQPQPSLSPPAGFNGSDRLASTRLPSQPLQTPRHPYGLDSTQVGVDFVLFMERCCIYHVHQPQDREEPHGHAMTALAPVLNQAPQSLDDCTTWQIPSCELDRLLELSSALELDGELTPVQMWARIKQHPLFHKLDPEGLRKLSNALVAGVQCFGFGATFEEQFFTKTVDEFLGALKD